MDWDEEEERRRRILAVLSSCTISVARGRKICIMKFWQIE